MSEQSPGPKGPPVSKDSHLVFDASLVEKEGAPAKMGKILKISPLGCLFQMTGTTALRIGDQCHLQFSVPGSDVLMLEPVKVMKSYLRWAEAKSGLGLNTDLKANLKIQILEFHFLQLSSQRRSLISSFNEKNPSKD